MPRIIRSKPYNGINHPSGLDALLAELIWRTIGPSSPKIPNHGELQFNLHELFGRSTANETELKVKTLKISACRTSVENAWHVAPRCSIG